MTRTPSRTRGAGLVALATMLALVLPGVADAHEGIDSSEPASGTTIDEPISEVTIEFNDLIGDDVELALLDPDEELVESTTIKTGESSARMEFAPLEREGTYIVRYVGSAPDGHLLVGAISFDYGDAGSSDTAARLLLLAGAIGILGVGALLTVRRHRLATGDAAGDEIDTASEDPVDA